MGKPRLVMFGYFSCWHAVFFCFAQRIWWLTHQISPAQRMLAFHRWPLRTSDGRCRWTGVCQIWGIQHIAGNRNIWCFFTDPPSHFWNFWMCAKNICFRLLAFCKNHHIILRIWWDVKDLIISIVVSWRRGKKMIPQVFCTVEWNGRIHVPYGMVGIGGVPTHQSYGGCLKWFKMCAADLTEQMWRSFSEGDRTRNLQLI